MVGGGAKVDNVEATGVPNNAVEACRVLGVGGVGVEERCCVQVVWLKPCDNQPVAQSLSCCRQRLQPAAPSY